MRGSISAPVLFAFLCALVLLAAPAQANRALITEEALATQEGGEHPSPPPEGQVEDACGLAPLPGGGIYVSDYYHRLVGAFTGPSKFPHLFAFEAGSGISAGTSPEGPCQLALDSKGALYTNLWHESVVRLKPSFQVFDEDSSTGVAVDGEGNVYVNDRTHVSVYSSAGAKTGQIGSPASLGDAYGIAVFAGRVYVPDAASGTIKVFEPDTDSLNPAFTISGNETPQHGFNSLVDSAVAIDPTNGHLLVLDNLQPGFEHPKAAVDEFTATGTFLGQLKHTVIDGEPSGMTVEPALGALFVTSGNSEGANVFAFGPYTESGPETVEAAPEAVGPEVAEGGAGAAVREAPLVAPDVPVASHPGAKHRRHKARRAPGKVGKHRKHRAHGKRWAIPHRHR